MARLNVLDLGCCEGGASMGFVRVGFDVLGVDLVRRKQYPFAFAQGDMLTFPLAGFDVLFASVPCQDDSVLHKRWPDRQYPNLLAPIRERFMASGKPWMIECVSRAKFGHGVTLCGSMFGLKVRRHRTFESSHLLYAPGKCRHKEQGQPITVTGHGGHVYHTMEAWQAAMGIDWMDRYGMSQAIPPAFTEYLGKQLLDIVLREKVA